MDIDIVTLHQQIGAVCPIDGICIGDPADKSTWRIDFQEEATDAQKAAAEALLMQKSAK